MVSKSACCPSSSDIRFALFPLATRLPRKGTSKRSRGPAAFFPAGDSPSQSRPPADRNVILGRARAQRRDSRGSSATCAEGAKHFRVFDDFYAGSPSALARKTARAHSRMTFFLGAGDSPSQSRPPADVPKTNWPSLPEHAAPVRRPYRVRCAQHLGAGDEPC